MTAKVSLRSLLQNLQGELSTLADRCHALQGVAGTLLARPAEARVLDADQLIALQDFDAITQTLEDLASLAGSAARGGLGRVRVDPEMLRSELRLDSLTQRLLGISAADETDGEGFLL